MAEENPTRTATYDALESVLDAVRSDFADATNNASVRDVSHAFEIIAMQQEALVLMAEILNSIDIDNEGRKKLIRASKIIGDASTEFQKNLGYVCDTHLRAQRGEA